MSTPNNDGYYEAYWPRGARQQKTRALAPRLDTLEGKTVAQLWDYLFKGDEVFALLEEVLKRRSPAWPVEAAARPPCCGPAQHAKPPVTRRHR